MHGELASLLAAVACGAFVTVAEPVTVPLLRRLAAIDTPNQRSSHTVPTPRGGGAPIAIGVLLAAVLIHSAVLLTFGATVGLFAAIGLADDLAGLPARRRLALQGAAGLAAGGLLAGMAEHPEALALAAAAGLAIWIVGFVNAFNFMDGVNGISATHALLGGVMYTCLGLWRPDASLAAAGGAVAAGALAFLPWNAVRARVFLGDVGSYALGAALALLAAWAVIRGIPPEAALGPLALYLADTAWTLQRRIRAGENWLEAHRTHTYQRLCDVGWSHQRVTLGTGAATAVLSLLGAVSLTPHLGLRVAADLTAVGLLAAYLRSPALLARPGKAARRARRPEPPDMRTLIVSHYFPPETGAPQARLSELAAHWAAGGDEVTVLTGMPSHPTGILPPEYRHAIRRRERRDGYAVLRTWLYATPNEGIARKTLSHLSFMITSVLLGWRASGRADTVVVSSPTFFSIASAWLLARIKRARLIVEVRDLWPAIFVELGVLTSRRVIRVLERLELAAYAAADEVVVVSDGFRANLISRGVPADKVHTIRNGVDVRRFSPATPADPYLRAGLGARPDECLVLYAGTHGISQGLPEAVTAATRLTGRPVHLAFAGEGADKARLRHQVTSLALANVTLANAVPSDLVPTLLASADILLVTLRDVPLFTTFIPSKMFEYLAADRPVIGAVAGEAAQILREAGGVVVPPGDSDALAAAIRDLAADRDERAVMAAQGRAYVERFFDRAELARQYRKILAAAGDTR